MSRKSFSRYSQKPDDHFNYGRVFFHTNQRFSTIDGLKICIGCVNAHTTHPYILLREKREGF
jgi:hypothetical protein